MYYNRIPKPLPILLGLPDDPKPKFIWMKYDDIASIKGRLSKRIIQEQNCYQNNKLKMKENMNVKTSIASNRHYEETQIQKPNYSTSVLKVQQQNIYYEDFPFIFKESITRQLFSPIKNLYELQESLKNIHPYSDSLHPREYEIFSGQEGFNVQEIFYCKSEVVKIVLRSDTNSHGFCQWFTFGLRINTNKEMKITINIINLRNSEKYGTVHVLRESDGHEYYLQSKHVITKEKRRKGTGNYIQCTFEIKSSSERYIISHKKPFSYQFLNSHSSQYGQLGLSVLQYPIYYWTQQKPGPLILILARIRPADTVTSFLAEEIISQLKSTSLNAIVVPMLNTDGVLLGNSRCNLNGKDLCFNYQYPNPYLCPEIKSILGIENVHLAIELRTHQIPHVVSSLQFNCGLPIRAKNKEAHDISTKFQRYVKIFMSPGLDEFQQLAKQIISALLQQQYEDQINNVSFNSVTIHDDDILDNFYFNTNPVDGTKKPTQQIQLQDLLYTISPSQKEIESVNQLKNLEWKDLSNRTEIQSAKFKTSFTPTKEPLFFEKKQIRNKMNYHQYSESQHSQSSQKEKIQPKNPFLPSREQLFKQYSAISGSPSHRRSKKLQSYTSYQVFKSPNTNI